MTRKRIGLGCCIPWNPPDSDPPGSERPGEHHVPMWRWCIPLGMCVFDSSRFPTVHCHCPAISPWCSQSTLIHVCPTHPAQSQHPPSKGPLRRGEGRELVCVLRHRELPVIFPYSLRHPHGPQYSILRDDAVYAGAAPSHAFWPNQTQALGLLREEVPAPSP